MIDSQQEHFLIIRSDSLCSLAPEPKESAQCASGSTIGHVVHLHRVLRVILLSSLFGFCLYLRDHCLSRLFVLLHIYLCILLFCNHSIDLLV